MSVDVCTGGQLMCVEVISMLVAVCTCDQHVSQCVYRMPPYTDGHMPFMPINVVVEGRQMTIPMPHGQHNGERMGIYQLNQGVYALCVCVGGGGGGGGEQMTMSPDHHKGERMGIY